MTPRPRHRLSAVAVLAASAMALSGCSAAASAAGGDADGPVTFAVSGPETGPNAEYGGFWKKGFDLALDEINAAGGVDGRKVKLDWHDSQSDPKQSVTVAQKIVGDDDVIAELGDFSSPASMAATPIYQRAGLVQYGFTNSSPDFTKGGDVAFAPTLDQSVFEVTQADAVVKVGKRISVLYQNTDWGKSTFDVFAKEVKKQGGTLSSTSAYLPDHTDFRSLLRQAKASHPDVLYILGYDPDEATIIKQARQIGWDVTIFTAQFSQTAVKLAGKDAAGVYTTNSWWPKSSEPRVKDFVTKYKAKYHELPNQFEAGSYDALHQLVAAAKKGGATREGVKKGLEEDKKLPSVIYGPFAFNGKRRPPKLPQHTIVVKDGALALAD